MPLQETNLSELKFIKQVGPKRQEALNASGINTVADLLTYFPRSYIDRTAAGSVSELSKNLLLAASNEDAVFNFGIQSEAVIIGKIINANLREIRNRKKILQLVVRDTLGANFEVIFFQFADAYYNKYSVGTLIAVSGKPVLKNNSYNRASSNNSNNISNFNSSSSSNNFNNISNSNNSSSSNNSNISNISNFYNNFSSNKLPTLSFVHPEVDIIEEEDSEFYSSGGVIPRYKITDEMRKAGINNRVLRQIISNALALYSDVITETLPEYVLANYSFPNLNEAINILHLPASQEVAASAMKRIKFEELFYYQLAMRLQRQEIIEKENGIIVLEKSTSARKLYDSLPFKLSSDQKKVLNEFALDFASGKAMNRLLQGDVGSGKTIVSVLTMLMLVDAGYQVVMMAPTELLAEQHYYNLSNLLKNIDINVVQLVGGMRKKAKRELMEKIVSGEANIIVGTHALFQSEVQYRNLGLVVIDEQHRFGVMQRGELIKLARDSMLDNSLVPHVLYMTATPIPRTLTMTLYGDLDVSVIKTMPQNRLPIKTKVTFESQRADVYKFIDREISAGHQAYIVFPLVEKSEKLELKSAVEHHQLIQEEFFPNMRCGLLHGQMLWYEKEEVMEKFLAKEYNILVATTVIEVGIDVPRATVMLIENAERFGLTQLHQLRGRVGRSSYQSYCFLMTKDNFKFQLGRTKNNEDEKIAAIVRLRTIQETCDGFKIAEADMKLRGPGDIMGTKQAGLPNFKYADIVNDVEILSQASQLAIDIARSDRQLEQSNNLILRNNLQKQYSNSNIFLNIA